MHKQRTHKKQNSKILSANLAASFIPQKICSSIVLGLILSANAYSFTPSISCGQTETTASCLIHLAPNLTLESSTSQTLQQYDGSYYLGGTVTVIAGAARFPMFESELVVDLSSTPEIYGSAEIPFDEMSGLEKVNFDTLPRLSVGLMQADTVDLMVGKPVPLNVGIAESGSRRPDDIPYFVFHADAGLAMSYDFGESLQALNNVSLTVPGSLSVTAIFDPFDPYFYWSFEETEGLDLSDIQSQPEAGYTVYELTDDNGDVMIRYTQTDSGDLIEENLITDELITYGRNAEGNYVMDGSDPENPVVLDGKQFNPAHGQRFEADTNKDKNEADRESGSDIGSFAFSANGWIPFDLNDFDNVPHNLGAFSGQIMLSGAVPLGTSGINIDGEVIAYAGEQGVALGGKGDVLLSFPGLPDFISFDVPLGNAASVVNLTETSQLAFVSGELKPDTQFIQDYLPISPQAGALVQGYIDSDLGESYVRIEGEMGLGADTLGDWIGVDLNALQMTKATMLVDADGFEVTGKSFAQIHPDIALNTEVNVLATMSWATPEDITLRLSGDMEVFGVELEDVSIEINSVGMFINGAFVTPATRIDVLGQIDNQGPLLSGSGEVTLDLGDITGAINSVREDIEAAQAEVARIEYLIASMRNTVQAERDHNAQKLAEAQSALNAAQSVVNGLNNKIASENRSISARKSQIASWYSWYKKAKWYEKASRYSRYAYEKSWRTADIARRYTLIGTYKASLAVATLSLDAARLALQGVQAGMDVFPIDADPRIIALFTAKESANLALNLAKAPLEGIPNVDAEISGLIRLTLDTHGLQGAVSAEANGISLADGWLKFEPRFEACIEYYNLGTACTKL